jgi:putative C-S lyase
MYEIKPNVAEGVIPLSVADMELNNPPEITEGLKEFLSHAVLGYTEPTKSYKDAVIGWMKERHGWDAKEEWFIQTPGVVSAFFAAVNALTNEGDGVIIQPPVYYPFAMAVNLNQRTLVNNPLLVDANGVYRMDYADLEKKAADPKNKLLLLCSPHNPVGRVWTREELSRVAEICLRNSVFVVSDEIHFDIVLNGASHTVFADLSSDAQENCMVCTAPSKTFNLAGLQTSNIAIPNKAARDKITSHYIRQAQFSVNVLGMKACEIAYTKCGKWLDEFLRLLEANHSAVQSFFSERLPSVAVHRLEGTYLQWLDFRSFGLGQRELEHFMQHDAEWFTDEGYLFGNEGVGFERINLACPKDTLQEALERLLKASKARGLA